MKHRSVAWLLAVVAFIAAHPAAAGAAPHAGKPSVEVSVGAATSGQEVVVVGKGWPATSALSVMVCGAAVGDGTDECDVLGGATVVSDRTGIFRTPLVVRVPPAPCPCVVRAFSASRDVDVREPISIVGAPLAPPSGSQVEAPTTEATAPTRANPIESDRGLSDGLGWPVLAVVTGAVILVLAGLRRRTQRRGRHLIPQRNDAAHSESAESGVAPDANSAGVRPAETAVAAPAPVEPAHLLDLNPEAASLADDERPAPALRPWVENLAQAVPVEFTLQGAKRANVVTLSGEFNDWARDATRLDMCDEGWTVTIPLEPGRSYRYQYLVDGQWLSEYAAGPDALPDLFESWYSVVTVGHPPGLEGCLPAVHLDDRPFLRTSGRDRTPLRVVDTAVVAKRPSPF
jgi:hypothetical protein